MKTRSALEPTRFIGFPDETEPRDYRIVSYIQGNEVCTCKSLTFDHFNVISFQRASKSQLTKIDYIHAIGNKTREKQNTWLVLQRIKRK